MRNEKEQTHQEFVLFILFIETKSFFCKKIICNFILVAKHICNYFLRGRVGYLDRKFSALKEVLNEQQYRKEGLCIERFISFKIKTRKDTGFKSLQSITQVIKKCKMWTGFSRIFTWLSYSVVFVKKINLLSLRQCCFPGNLQLFDNSFSKEQQWAAASVLTLKRLRSDPTICLRKYQNKK